MAKYKVGDDVHVRGEVWGGIIAKVHRGGYLDPSRVDKIYEVDIAKVHRRVYCGNDDIKGVWQCGF